MGEAYILRRGSGGIPGNWAVIVARVPSGATVTATKDGIILTPKMWVTEADPTKDIAIFALTPAQFDADTPWTITATDGGSTASTTVLVTANKEYEVELSFLVPAEYQAVEYLERPEQSGAYFNTGIVPVRTDFVEVRYKILTFASYPWILGLAVGGGYWGFQTAPGGNTTFLAYPNDTSVAGLTNHDSVVQFTGGNKVRYSSDDGENFTEVSLANSTSPTNPFLIFATTGYVQKGANNMRVKRVTIADAEFVPCYRKSDSVPGIWNRRDKVFITKSGTDAIIAGPDL
jgi:hypothetical protein